MPTSRTGAAGRASLPPILRHGESQVKVLTAAGMREWRRLRLTMPAISVDQLVYADRMKGEYWRPENELAMGGPR